MAANTAPIYARTPQIEWGTITTQNTAMNGTGTVVTVFTADATEGSFLDEIRFRALGTNIKTVARIWLNNGSTNATPANNSLITEVSLPASTADADDPTNEMAIRVEKAIPAGYKINVTIGTTIASGYAITAFGGKY